MAEGWGQVVGRIYLDMHPREGKSKWFSECSLVGGVLVAQCLPEASLVCNFPQPTEQNPDDAGLMQYSDVVTYFHEFGHLMHEVLGGRQRWAGAERDCDGRRFRRSALADAGGVL
jgi:thimet oligopeptidase